MTHYPKSDQFAFPTPASTNANPEDVLALGIAIGHLIKELPIRCLERLNFGFELTTTSISLTFSNAYLPEEYLLELGRMNDEPRSNLNHSGPL